MAQIDGTRNLETSESQDRFSGTPVQITLNAVLATIDDGDPKVLCIQRRDGRTSEATVLPYGPFDPRRHRTFEIGLRDWVNRQSKLDLGYVEQLYTFGDRGREATPSTMDDNPVTDVQLQHLVSVGYLALTPLPAPVNVDDGRWRNWYRFFPWEDWRQGEPLILRDEILPQLARWIAASPDPASKVQRERRVRQAFGMSDTGWEEERTLDRYELMYEARLVDEANGNNASGSVGLPMAFDHRRILATAISRLRGKLKYRPVVFEILPSEFTLLDLQKRVEAIIGFRMHKQNFRRSIESSGLVQRTGNLSEQTGGRPAALYTVNQQYLREHSASGLTIPRLRTSPTYGVDLEFEGGEDE